jgi:threonine/homoserine/homoserine lactone efflux protein
MELAAANASAPIVEPAAEAPEDSGILVRRLHAFTVPAIIAGGLADGVNPCAFATIVFLVTLLSVSGRRERDLLRVGTVYCVAVLATYFLLGLGAFRLLQGLQAYGTASEWLRRAMVVLLIVLAALSFRDAWKFRKSGRPQDVTLQLPEGIKRRMHDIMRVRVSSGGLLAGALVTGFLVTLLESVCTGQVYLPTLVFLTRHPDLHGRTWALLALYNLMFIVPLVVVFVAAYRGVRSQRLVEWSKRNVVWGKFLMGLFFLALALVILRA